MGLSQRLRGAGEDRVDRPGADPRAEQLLTKLHHIPAGDAVASAERRDGRLETRAERAPCDLPRQLVAGLLTTARAAHTLSTMLGDLDLTHRQLLDLPANRFTDRDPLLKREGIPAATAPRPILDDLVHRPRRQERSTVALVTWLGALFASRWILATHRSARRKIRARWRRARAAVQPALELSDPLILASDMRL